MAARTGNVGAHISRAHPFGITYTVLDEGAATKNRAGGAIFQGLEVRLRVEYTAGGEPVLALDGGPYLIQHDPKEPPAGVRESISPCDIPSPVIRALLESAERNAAALPGVREALEEAMVVKALRGDFIRG